jgi:hypothetical protein
VWVWCSFDPAAVWVLGGRVSVLGPDGRLVGRFVVQGDAVCQFVLVEPDTIAL